MAAMWCASRAKAAEPVLRYVSRRLRFQPRIDTNEHECLRMKTKILIVEDDPHILLGLEEVLKSDGFEVAVCNRGDHAVDAVSRHRPSLIVLDVMLPGKSGYDICRELRGKKVTTPILMLTADNVAAFPGQHHVQHDEREIGRAHV